MDLSEFEDLSQFEETLNEINGKPSFPSLYSSLVFSAFAHPPKTRQVRGEAENEHSASDPIMGS